MIFFCPHKISTAFILLVIQTDDTAHIGQILDNIQLGIRHVFNGSFVDISVGNTNVNHNTPLTDILMLIIIL